MRVLYLVSGIGPPAGWGTEFIQNLIFELSGRGVKATVINPIYGHTHPDWRTWCEKQNKKYGVKIIPLEVPSWIRNNFLLHLYLTPLFVTWSAVSILRKERFDLVHEFSSTPFILFRAGLFKLFLKVPTVFTLSVFNASILGKFFWFKIFDFAKYYLIPSKQIISELVKFGINPNRIIFSPPGLYLDKLKAKLSKTLSRKKLDLPEDKCIFSYFGSLTKEKGVEEIIEAASAIDTNLQDKILIALFVIWKGSTEHQRIKSKILTLNLPHLKLFEQYVDIPTLISASDVVLLPQQTGHGTTIPVISIIEALANQKFVVATDILTNKEIISKSDGTLIPPKNPVALTQAIESAYSGLSKEKEGPQDGSSLSLFEMDNSIKLHLHLYNQISGK